MVFPPLKTIKKCGSHGISNNVKLPEILAWASVNKTIELNSWFTEFMLSARWRIDRVVGTGSDDYQFEPILCHQFYIQRKRHEILCPLKCADWRRKKTGVEDDFIGKACCYRDWNIPSDFVSVYWR